MVANTRLASSYERAGGCDGPAYAANRGESPPHSGLVLKRLAQEDAERFCRERCITNPAEALVQWSALLAENPR